MSERDELAEVIESVDVSAEWDVTPDAYDMYADAILAAGYRKPRTITTVDELDALPGSAVVKDEFGQVFEKQEVGQWHDGPHDWLAFDGKFWDVDAIHFPATVLYEPQP